MSGVAFDRVGHLTRIPVLMPDGRVGRFVVDTGIGISVVNSSTARRYDLPDEGSFTGQRMSGQAVTAALTRLPALSVAGVGVGDCPAAIADLGAVDGPDGFDGILGLDVLGDHCLTIDPFAGTLSLGRPTTASGQSFTVSVRPHRQGPSLDLRVDLRLPDGSVVEVEVDTGSARTILDSPLMAACAVDGTEPGARTVEGTDETGHEFVRRFIQIPGAVGLVEAPGTAHCQPTVMFQDLAFDGLIGTDFLDRFIQTYDTTINVMTLTPAPDG